MKNFFGAVAGFGLTAGVLGGLAYTGIVNENGVYLCAAYFGSMFMSTPSVMKGADGGAAALGLCVILVASPIIAPFVGGSIGSKLMGSHEPR